MTNLVRSFWSWRRGVGPLFALALLVLAPPAWAERTVVKASAGATTAEFSYQRTSDQFSGYRAMRIRVIRNGIVRVDQAVPNCSRFCVPFGDSTGLSLRDVDADGEPEVLLNVFTGGANCCEASLIFSYRPQEGVYRRLDGACQAR